MFHSSYGTINDIKTEIKFTATFDPPSTSDKNLVLNMIYKENNETGKISFSLDKNKAMGHSIKKSLYKNIKTDDTNLRLKYISASPTTTVIKGNVENILELSVARMHGITFSPSRLDLNLIADGKIVQKQESELSSSIDGVTFKYNFDPLPNDFKKLQIQFLSLTSEHIIDRNFKIKKDMQNENINIEDKNVEIKKIYQANGNTYITFSTEPDVILTKVNIIMDGENIKLNKTIPENSPKNSNISTRTLEFIGTGNNLELNIQRMIYKKNYDKIIDIISS